MSERSVRDEAARQREVGREVERMEDRDTGHTLVGFGVFLGAVAGALWLAGVDIPGPVFGVAILFLIGGLVHVAASRD